jgi:hypothetical protein
VEGEEGGLVVGLMDDIGHPQEFHHWISAWEKSVKNIPGRMQVSQLGHAVQIKSYCATEKRTCMRRNWGRGLTWLAMMETPQHCIHFSSDTRRYYGEAGVILGRVSGEQRTRLLSLWRLLVIRPLIYRRAACNCANSLEAIRVRLFLTNKSGVLIGSIV